MPTSDWQTPDTPAPRCKAKTTPANSGRKDGLPTETSPASCAADCPKTRNIHSARTEYKNGSSPQPHPPDNLISAETHQCKRRCAIPFSPLSVPGDSEPLQDQCLWDSRLSTKNTPMPNRGSPICVAPVCPKTLWHSPSIFPQWMTMPSK